jgi:hypothetical protein
MVKSLALEFWTTSTIPVIYEGTKAPNQQVVVRPVIGGEIAV